MLRHLIIIKIVKLQISVQGKFTFNLMIDIETTWIHEHIKTTTDRQS